MVNIVDMNGGRKDWILSSLFRAARTRVRFGPAGARIQVITADFLYCQRSVWKVGRLTASVIYQIR